jgi:hypothetical protein
LAQPRRAALGSLEQRHSTRWLGDRSREARDASAGAKVQDVTDSSGRQRLVECLKESQGVLEVVGDRSRPEEAGIAGFQPQRLELSQPVRQIVGAPLRLEHYG